MRAHDFPASFASIYSTVHICRVASHLGARRAIRHDPAADRVQQMQLQGDKIDDDLGNPCGST
jgi:hypothetical protein